MDYEPSAKTYALDDLLVWPDLWVTAHVWAEGNEQPPGFRQITWINFRLIEWEAEEDGPAYPGSPGIRGAKWAQSKDARVAEAFAEGFLKWDGCMEIQMDHHMCGVFVFQQAATAILRLFLWAGEQHGFEECEMAEEAS